MAEIDWKKRFVELWKKGHLGLYSPLDDICNFCVHDYKKICNKDCPYKCSGDTGIFVVTPSAGCVDLNNGKEVKMKWTCLDFDFTDCPGLENTLCAKCVNSSNYGGFELDEEKLEKYFETEADDDDE